MLALLFGWAWPPALCRLLPKKPNGRFAYFANYFTVILLVTCLGGVRVSKPHLKTGFMHCPQVSFAQAG